jgi:hypothetical protein
VDINDVRVGSCVVLRPGFGEGLPIKAIVIEVDPDIANGRAGVTYATTTANSLHWAYMDQVDKVVRY